MNQNAPQNMDHLNETMLYKCPGPHEIHGGNFDYVIVPEADIGEAQAQGWHLTTEEARAAHEAPPAVQLPFAVTGQQLHDSALSELGVDSAVVSKDENEPPTYEEMKAKATELGLEFRANINKAALLAMINAKLAEQV